MPNRLALALRTSPLSCAMRSSLRPCDTHDAPIDPTQHASQSQRGASLVEYALLVSLIAVAALGSLRAFSSSQSDDLNENASRLSSAMENAGP